MKKIRAIKALVHDAVDATVELVREGNESGARAVRRATDPIEGLNQAVRVVDGIRKVTTAGVLESVHLINHVVEAVTDAGLDLAQAAQPQDTVEPQPTPVAMRSDTVGSLSWLGDATLGVLNAAVGDYLDSSGNALDLSMKLRVADQYLDLSSDEALAQTLGPAPSSRLLVFVHGLATTEWSWFLGSEGYYGEPGISMGSQLADELGFGAIYVRYNTGRAIEHNGRELAQALDALVSAYPVPVESITLIGHSMGGLVTRSACHWAEDHELPWAKLVPRVFYLGSPHQGAPLARFGEVLTQTLGGIDLPATRVIANILDGRSVGTKDLRYGAPQALQEVLPLAHATHYFILATITDKPDQLATHILGDLLVRVPSASASAIKAHTFSTEVHHHGKMMHHQLQNHPAVYEQLLSALKLTHPDVAP